MIGQSFKSMPCEKMKRPGKKKDGFGEDMRGYDLFELSNKASCCVC